MGPERAEAYRILAAIDYEPERWLWRAIGECPERREPWVDLARWRFLHADVDGAAAAFNEAERRTDDALYTTDPGAWGERFEALRAAIGADLPA